MELYHDNFQNYKRYNIPKAQLVIADIPYNLAEKAYASSPMWYNGGDNANGESKLAKKSFFNSDGQFRLAEYMHFCSTLLKKEPKGNNEAPAMIVFCAFDQDAYLIELAKRYGFNHCYPIFFVKNYSAQVLKARSWEQQSTHLCFTGTSCRNSATGASGTKTESQSAVPERWFLIGLSGAGIAKRNTQKSTRHKSP